MPPSSGLDRCIRTRIYMHMPRACHMHTTHMHAYVDGRMCIAPTNCPMTVPVTTLAIEIACRLGQPALPEQRGRCRRKISVFSLAQRAAKLESRQWMLVGPMFVPANSATDTIVIDHLAMRLFVFVLYVFVHDKYICTRTSYTACSAVVLPLPLPPSQQASLPPTHHRTFPKDHSLTPKRPLCKVVGVLHEPSRMSAGFSPFF